MASTQPKHSGQAHFFWPVLWPLFTSSSRPGGPLVSEECLSPTPPRFLVIVLPSTSPTHGHAHRVQYVMEGRTGRFAAALALAVVSFCVWSVSASPLLLWHEIFCGRSPSRTNKHSHISHTPSPSFPAQRTARTNQHGQADQAGDRARRRCRRRRRHRSSSSREHSFATTTPCSRRRFWFSVILTFLRPPAVFRRNCQFVYGRGGF
jgi:hypothetical protein